MRILSPSSATRCGRHATLGIPLKTGREFGVEDSPTSPRVVVINETTARQYFGTANPLGTRVSFRGRQGPWFEIVGIVGDSKYATLGEPPVAVAYLPVSQNHETGMTLCVRSSIPLATLTASLRREIQALEPNLPVPDVATMTETVGTSSYAARMGAWLIALFGGPALLLAAIGVYGGALVLHRAPHT